MPWRFGLKCQGFIDIFMIFVAIPNDYNYLDYCRSCKNKGPVQTTLVHNERNRQHRMRVDELFDWYRLTTDCIHCRNLSGEDTAIWKHITLTRDFFAYCFRGAEWYPQDIVYWYGTVLDQASHLLDYIGVEEPLPGPLARALGATYYEGFDVESYEEEIKWWPSPSRDEEMAIMRKYAADYSTDP